MKKDGVLQFMRRHGIPVTRMNYLDFAYMGKLTVELSPEEEANLPPMLRRVK